MWLPVSLILFACGLVLWSLHLSRLADQRAEDAVEASREQRVAARGVLSSKGENRAAVDAWLEVWPHPTGPAPDAD